MSNENKSLALTIGSEETATRHHDTPIIDIQTIEQFNAMVNQEPEAHEVDVNKAANNSRFIPISFIQMKMDKVFFGLWRTNNFRYQVIVNEVCGVVTLEYFHPIAKIWITREGAASVMIMQKSGSDISDVNAKIKNTLQKDLPHLYASCVSSAAKTIGKWFGRDLNRKSEDEYQTFYTDIAKSNTATEAIEWDKVRTTADLKKIWDSHPDLHNNDTFKKTFTYRKGQISKLKNAA